MPAAPPCRSRFPCCKLLRPHPFEGPCTSASLADSRRTLSRTRTMAQTNTTPVRSPDPAKQGDSLRVTSASFTDGGKIPMDNVFTGCGGKNTAPQLAWTGAPSGTKSYAITCFDPDAPTGSGYWHWVAFDIPAKVTSLDAGAGNASSPAG